jgi:pumilio RNA-binding family
VELLKCTVQLVQDQYGNYVIQHVLVNGRPEHKLTIVQKLKGSYLKLSKNKFGSNVVEKCVQYSGDAERDMIIEEIVGTEENW